MKVFLLVLLGCSIVASFNHNCPNSEGIVDTEGGCVQGVVMNNIRWFKGIPFAEPPVRDMLEISNQNVRIERSKIKDFYWLLHTRSVNVYLKIFAEATS
jgi:hypothetical protein